MPSVPRPFSAPEADTAHQVLVNGPGTGAVIILATVSLWKLQICVEGCQLLLHHSLLPVLRPHLEILFPWMMQQYRIQVATDIVNLMWICKVHHHHPIHLHPLLACRAVEWWWCRVFLFRLPEHLRAQGCTCHRCLLWVIWVSMLPDFSFCWPVVVKSFPIRYYRISDWLFYQLFPFVSLSGTPPPAQSELPPLHPNKTLYVNNLDSKIKTDSGFDNILIT